MAWYIATRGPSTTPMANRYTCSKETGYIPAQKRDRNRRRRAHRRSPRVARGVCRSETLAPVHNFQPENRKPMTTQPLTFGAPMGEPDFGISRLAYTVAVFCLAASLGASNSVRAADVEQWGVWETSLVGPRDGNPYLEVQLSATFSQGDRHVTVPGFYDGDGVYRVRFSPPAQGQWRYETRSQPAGVERQERFLHRRSAIGEQPRTGASVQDILPALRRRHSLSSVWHYLLRVGSPDRRIAATDAQDAGRIALQQNPLLRVSQVVHLQSERTGAVRIPQAGRWHSLTSTVPIRRSGIILSGAFWICSGWVSRPT